MNKKFVFCSITDHAVTVISCLRDIRWRRMQKIIFFKGLILLDIKNFSYYCSFDFWQYFNVFLFNRPIFLHFSVLLFFILTFYPFNLYHAEKRKSSFHSFSLFLFIFLSFFLFLSLSFNFSLFRFFMYYFSNTYSVSFLFSFLAKKSC